jgi:hypothetical protein
MKTDKQTKPTDTSDSPLLRPVAKEGANAEASAGKGAAKAEPNSPLRLGFELIVQLPHVPASERERIARKARETMEQAVTREFRHWETRATTCAVWLPAPAPRS